MEFIQYAAVTNSSGEPQDINANDGKRWNLLYYTKKSNYGSPIAINQLGKIFTRNVNNINTPSDFEPVTCFGERTAANLNSYVRKKDTNSLYLFYTTKDRIDGIIYQEDNTVEENKNADDDEDDDRVKLNKGTPVKLEKGEKYLYNIMVSTEETESAAKAGISKHSGFKVYDKNLTPGNGFTYIGYSSTTVKKDAIRDIRIVPNYNGVESIRFGKAGYASAGKLPNEAHLVYTRYESAGSPIIDTFITSDKASGLDKKYEPVNLLCGGNAYNLGGSGQKLYLYFKPSIAYTSGDQYISGLQFVSGCKADHSRWADELINELGLKKYNYNLAPADAHSAAEEWYYGIYQGDGYGGKYRTSRSYTRNLGEYRLYLCYSLTYNPYRAIYNTTLYTATSKISSLPKSISDTKGGYVAAMHTCISDGGFFDAYLDKNYDELPFGWKSKWDTETIKIVDNNSYIDKKMGRDNSFARTHKTMISPYTGVSVANFEGNITWNNPINTSDIRNQGLYQMGPVEGEAPLKESDIVLSTSNTAPVNMHSIKKINNPSDPSSVDISYYAQVWRGTPTYLYMSGKEKSKGKYISGIDLVTYEKPENTSQHTYTEDELKELGKSADDSCILELCSKLDGDVLNYNLAINSIKAWYRNPSTDSTEASYMAVTRTDDESYAITGILLYKAGSKDTPPVRLKVNSVEYRRTGDRVGDYYLYYTKSPGASPGFPLEEITFDDVKFVDGTTTAMGFSSADDKGNASYMKDVPYCNGYFHLKTDTDNSIVNGITLVKGNYNDVAVKAMQDGYTNIISTSLNTNAKGSDIYLAYKICPESVLDMDTEALLETEEEFEEEWDSDDDDWDFDDENYEDFHFDFEELQIEEYIVRDLVCIVGDKKEETINLGNKEYHLVSNLDLNEGTNGRSVYLYYTADSSGSYLAPISKVTLCSGDAVPDRDDDDKDRYGKWEMLLDKNGNEVNLNDGVVYWTDETSVSTPSKLVSLLTPTELVSEVKCSEVKDSRLYMFIQRFGGKVKKTAKINRGLIGRKFATGDLSIN